MAVHGMVQRDEEIIHVVARTLLDDTAMLRALSEVAMPSTLSAGDGAGSWRAAPDAGEHRRPAPDAGERRRPPGAATHPRNVNCIPKSRDFH
jgi:error-prone DNA polymerase